MGDVMTFVALGVLALATTLTLLCLAVTAALSKVDEVGLPASLHQLPPPSPPPLRRTPRPAQPQSQERRLRLLSRALFVSRSRDAITLDCTLVRVEVGPNLPSSLAPSDAPLGLPFTLQLRAPDAGWFVERVEELLRGLAEENRELVLELREDRGRVRTTIASGDSSVYLELASAAGLTQS